jgi:VWFA-related protein
MKVAALSGLLMLIVGVSLVSLQSGRPDDTSPRLRTGVSYVEVDAYVTDAAGAVVTDLTSADFELLEDGVKRNIEFFDRVQLSLPDQRGSTASGPAVEPALSVNDTPERAERVYVIVLDDLHIARANDVRVKAALRQFLGRALGSHDVAAVVYTSGRSADGQEFTNSIRLLSTAVDHFTGQKLRSATTERLQDPRLNSSGVVAPNADPFETERAHRAQTTLATLRQLGARLTPFTTRRKTMLFVSEGVDYEASRGATTRTSTQWSVNADLRIALSDLNRANVTVYALDPRGVATGTESLIESSSVFEGQGAGLRAARRELQQSYDVLQTLSANTGGGTLLWRQDMGRDFDRVVRESSNYYVLGYSMPAEPSGQVYRRIAVRVTRPGMRVRARDGYFARPSSNR